MNCDCPSCGSKNTKALCVLHQDGTRISASTRNGGGVTSGGRLGVFSSVTNGTSQSLTSLNAAPPVASFSQFLASGIVPLLLIASLVIWGGNAFLIALAVLSAAAILGAIVDARNHDKTMAKWENSFRCNRCGLIYEVDRQWNKGVQH